MPKRVAIYLYYIADESRMRKIANAFGISKSTASVIIRQVAAAISCTMAHYIQLPETEEEVKEKVTGFYNDHGFPQCIGAIDGTHVGIRRPKENSTDYINKNNNFSLNIQAICDHRYRFMNVVIQWPGSVHDSRMFANSAVNTMLKTGAIPCCPAELLPGEEAVPICIIGDPAYPLLPYLMTEYSGGGSNTQEQFYGYRLSSARMVIECSFGRLKGRFACLRGNVDINMSDLPTFLHSVFIMHNFCEQENQPVRQQDVESAQNYDAIFQPARSRTTENTNNLLAKRIRQCYTRYFD